MVDELLRRRIGFSQHRHARYAVICVVTITQPVLDLDSARDLSLTLPKHELFLQVIHVEKVRLLIRRQVLQIERDSRLLRAVHASAREINFRVADKIMQRDVAIEDVKLDKVRLVELDLIRRHSKRKYFVPLGIQRLPNRLRRRLESAISHRRERIRRSSLIHREHVVRFDQPHE